MVANRPFLPPVRIAPDRCGTSFALSVLPQSLRAHFIQLASAKHHVDLIFRQQAPRARPTYSAKPLFTRANPSRRQLPSSSPPESPQAALRRQNTTTVNRLLSSTIDWLAALPPNVRPLALATKYPRLANRIAQEWREPSACRKDFDDLVYDKRGTRRGFPPDVYVELLALRDYYYGYDLALAKEA